MIWLTDKMKGMTDDQSELNDVTADRNWAIRELEKTNKQQ